MRHPLAALLFLASTGFVSAEEFRAEQIAYFEKHIRPVLVESCYECHAQDASRVKGGLLLDNRESTLLGGESGQPGVVPGDPLASSIYTAMTWQDEDMEMPPKTKLPQEVIEHFKTWIEMGAPDPRHSDAADTSLGRHEIDIAEGRKHWAFQPPTPPELPATEIQNWAKSDIDTLVLGKMEEQGLHPVRDADRPTLIRRIAYDLTGLPPTPDEVKAFVEDSSDEAVERVIDMYLDSPRFGERWARHWLDVARYAESSGRDINVPYPNAWRYRDYVIESFNRDKPYDQFLREQIAGDLLVFDDERDQAEKIIATGFLAIGAKGLNTRDRRQFQMDVVDEQIDVMSQAMMGLTLACARCHDHKFDPVTQEDYYALAGIFMSSETLFGTQQQQQNQNYTTLIELEPEASQPHGLAAISPAEMRTLQQQMQQQQDTADQMRQEAFQARQRDPNADVRQAFVRSRAVQDRATTLAADLAQFHPDGTPRTLVMGVLDRSQPINSPLLIRGDVDQQGDTVPRALVEVLCAEDEPRKIAEGSGRLDLAFFIGSKDNPLTARVMANRVWLHLMGKGIVPTPDNFGVMGMAPTHPELLDHLALEFMEQNWSVKELIRRIMLSRTYQMSSTHHAGNYAADPDNTYRWRMDQRRLDAESLRDSMLAVSDTLDLYPTDGSPVARTAENRVGIIQMVAQLEATPQFQRSVYLPIVRDQIPEFLTVFDFPDASLVSGLRDRTNIPSQSLFLMNNPEVLRLSDFFAKRVAEFEGSPVERLTYAYQLALARSPNEDELAAIRSFWMSFTEDVQTGSGQRSAGARQEASGAALSAFCQALFASAEFRYLN